MYRYKLMVKPSQAGQLARAWGGLLVVGLLLAAVLATCWLLYKREAGQIAGRQADLEVVRVNLLAQLLHSELIARGVRADVELAYGLPQISGDSVQLQQVLLNLAINAMDAMSSTEPAQRQITLKTRHNGNGTVEAAVADRGRGLTSEERDRLFQPFFTTKEHGLGLGLSICSTIVKSHGGDLRIDNDAGGGAVAVLTLPSRSDATALS